MTERIPSGPPAAQLRDQVARALRLDPAEVGLDDDLVDLGLESTALIRLAGRWRREGLAADFSRLAADPTIRAWTRVLGEAAAAPDAADAADAAAPAPIPAAADLDPAAPSPLTPLQHAYWLGRQPGQPSGSVAAHFYVELDGAELDPERLRQALAALVARHASLRMRFRDDGTQQPLPEGEEPPAARLRVHDLRDLAAEAVAERLDRMRDAGTHRRMDVERGEVLRVDLSLLPGGGCRLHVDLDMLAGDAISLRVLLADLRVLVEEPERPLPTIRRDVRAELAARAARAEASRSSADARWWRERVPGLPAGPALPVRADAERADADRADAGGPEVAPRSRRLHHRIGQDELRLLEAAARARGLTVAAVLATAFAEVVAAWSAEGRFLLNLPVLDRGDEEGLELVVGEFSTSILLDVDLREERSFRDDARRIQQGVREAVDHAGYGGVDVLRDLARRDGGSPVLAPVVYTSAIGLGELYDAPIRRALGEPVWIISQGPQVWLDAQVTELEGGLLVNWDVRVDILEEPAMEAAFQAYRGLVDGLVHERPGAWDLPALAVPAPDDVRARLARERPAPDTGDGLLHSAFLARAAADPTRTALIGSDGREVAYGELADHARRVAGLLRAEGVGPGATVAITAPAGPDRIAAVLGVLLAGACYAPVGPDQPPARRAAILGSGIGIDCVLADDDLVAVSAEAVGADGPPAVALGAARDAEPLADPVAVAPDSPAYLLFTSGSTGRPKGVEVAHRAAVATIRSLAVVAPLGPDDRTIALSALDFDLSVYDLFAALSVGAAVVVPAEHERRDADRWRDLVRAHGVTVWNTVPALLDMLLTATADGPLPLRLVLLGGDVVGADLPGRLAACAPAARLLALGGMTEATIHSTVHEARPGDAADPASSARGLPWGDPLPGVRVRVVDERGRDRPDGVPGELLVGGHALARGYRGDPGLTAARFPTIDGERWYRSGDRGAYRRDAEGRPVLGFLGRADHQLKIRGHRVEPGEVEAALASAPGVQRAVVVAVAGALAAMVVPEPGAVVAADAVAAHAGALLPPSMACARVVVRDALPLTANGKVDRTRIITELAERPAPAPRADDTPLTPEERLVERIWSDLLGAPCGRADSFFAAGGDSLQATRSVAALRAAGATDASVAALFRHPVLADFAATLHLTTPEPADARARIVPDPAHAHDPFPLTDVQRAYAVGRDPRIPLGGVGTYHHTEFDGREQDLDLLAAAFDELVRRHPTLRTVISPDGTQRVLTDVPPVRVDVREVPADADPEAVSRELAAFRERTSHRRHDLAVWPLFDLDAVRYPDGRGGIRTRIGIGIDYAVVDALSIMILYTELDLIMRGLPLPPAPAELTFRDCVLQTRPDPERLRVDEEHWRARVAEMPDAPRLPLATADPAPRFTRRAHRFDAGWWTAFRDRCRAAGLTPTSMLATAYGHVLSRWTGQRDLTMTLTLFDRRDVHPDMPRLVGDFTGLTLLDHRAAESAAEAARGLQERLAGDLDHREVPASWILRERARLQGTAVAPVPVVFTSAIGVGDGAGVGDGVSADVSGSFGERIHGVSQSPQVLLDVQVLEDHGGLRIDADARDDAFPPGLVDALFAAYVATLAHLATADWDAPLPADPPADQARARATAPAAPAAPTTPRPGRLLHDGVHEAALRAPDAPALITGTGASARVVTHGQLADRALRIAGALQRCGIGPGDLVGITLPRGADQAAAVLGVLSAGAAYAPIGIGQPPARRMAIHRAAGIRLVIADDPAAAGGDAPDAPAILRPADAVAEEPLAAPVRPPVSALAYVIHTSGSTGEPKGVEIAHDAAWSTVDAVSRMLEVGPADRILALSALDFDLSVFDVLGVLGAGGALVIPEEGGERDAPRWLDLVHEHGVTLWDTVPMLLDMLLVAADDRPGRLGTLRAALVSGDRVGTDLHGRLMRAAGPGTRLVALGGATEAAIWSNAWEVDGPLDGWQSAPYGRPLPDQAFRVLDASGRDCPDWVPGELVIGGRGLARGYRGDPARTSAAFVELDGGRWYRTGDTGRYRPGGILEFLGRADRQVKLGGHRMELGEIEAAHAAAPGVRRAIALVVDGTAGRRHLHVAVQPDDGHDGAAVLAAATATAADRLPAYALPQRIHLVDAWPLTANGKVDVAALGRALAAVDADADADPAAAALAPATETATEAALAELWSGILGTAPDPDAGFFAAGGDSLAMLRLVTAAQRRFGVDAGVRRFLEEPTVRAYAACIDRLRAASDATPATTTPATPTTASADSADAPARTPAPAGTDLFESGDL